jgi:hypothetical protein
MPTDPHIIGFSNSWYDEGFKNRIKTKLPSTKDIYIFPLEFFIASKFEALNERGGSDWRFAHDLEDILLVLDGIKEPVPMLRAGKRKAKQYIANMFSQFIQRSDYEDILHSHIGNQSDKRIEKMKETLNLISNL